MRNRQKQNKNVLDNKPVRVYFFGKINYNVNITIERAIFLQKRKI